MIGFFGIGIELLLIIGLLIFSFVITSFTGLLQGFLIYIDKMNSLFLTALAVVTLYCANRNYSAFFHFTIHPAFCFLIGIGVYILSCLAQNTKVGFWIFAAIMSIFWAAVLSAITYACTKDMIWVCVIFGLSVLININSHLCARRNKLRLGAAVDTDCV